MKFVTRADTKKSAERAKKFYEQRGVPITIRAMGKGFALFTPDDYTLQAHSARSTRCSS